LKKNTKILIIDDIEKDVIELSNFLIKDGYDQITVIKDEKSFNKLNLIEEKYNVIISESEICGLNCLQLYNIVQQKLPGVIFIVASDRISDEFGIELLKEGVDMYFLKSGLIKIPVVIEKLIIGRSYANEIKKLQGINEELKQAYKIIEGKNKSIIESITFAKRIQTLTLPKIDILLKNFDEAFILYRPKDIVSGDFYWFHGGNGEGIFMAAIGDCTGHGVSGALLSMIGYNLLNEIVGDDNLLINPTDILSELDSSICKLLKQDGADGCGYQDGIDMSFITIDKLNKKISFCGCKRPLLYIVRNEKKIIVYKGEPYLIGGVSEKTIKTFKTQEIEYQTGDVIYMLTDGYTDQFGGERNKKFMKDKFGDILLSIQHLKLNYQSQLLEQKIIKWQGDYEQTDDILVVGIKL